MAGQAETGTAGQLAHGSMTGSVGTAGMDFSSFQVDRSCGRCGGLIAEPGKVYSYAGKWCHCPTIDSGSMIRRAAEARDAEEKRRQAELDDKQRGNALRDWLDSQPKRPPIPELTAHDFVVWMRGFFAGRSANPIDPHLEALLRDTLSRVKS